MQKKEKAEATIERQYYNAIYPMVQIPIRSSMLRY